MGTGREPERQAGWGAVFRGPVQLQGWGRSLTRQEMTGLGRLQRRQRGAAARLCP